MCSHNKRERERPPFPFLRERGQIRKNNNNIEVLLRIDEVIYMVTLK
jgi:hypothetical protein